MMRLTATRILLLAIFLPLTLCLPGCGKSPPEAGIVEGVVKVRGKPKSGLLIRFFPDPAKGNDLPINASGETDDQGKYRLQHVFEGETRAGAPVGWHRVMIEDSSLSGLPQGAPMPPMVVPPEYNSPATTPLEKEVAPGEQTIDIEL